MRLNTDKDNSSDFKCTGRLMSRHVAITAVNCMATASLVANISALCRTSSDAVMGVSENFKDADYFCDSEETTLKHDFKIIVFTSNAPS